MHDTQEWNPRYAVYAAGYGRSPAAQLAHDKAEYPGAAMTPFIIWCHRNTPEPAQ